MSTQVGDQCWNAEFAIIDECIPRRSGTEELLRDRLHIRPAAIVQPFGVISKSDTVVSMFEFVVATFHDFHPTFT